MSLIMPKIKRYIPVNGDTIQMENCDGDLYVILAPATNIATLNIAWPTSPQDGQNFTIVSTSNIATINHSGAVLNQNIAIIKAGGSFSFIYDAVGAAYMLTATQLSSNSTVSLPFSGTVAGGAGVALIYPTSDGTASGTALFSSIAYIHRDFNNGDPNYAAIVTTSGDKKTITATCKYQTFTGITLLSTNILGSVTLNNAANGTVLNILVQGVLA